MKTRVCGAGSYAEGNTGTSMPLENALSGFFMPHAMRVFIDLTYPAIAIYGLKVNITSIQYVSELVRKKIEI